MVYFVKENNQFSQKEMKHKVSKQKWTPNCKTNFSLGIEKISTQELLGWQTWGGRFLFITKSQIKIAG